MIAIEVNKVCHGHWIPSLPSLPTLKYVQDFFETCYVFYLLEIGKG